ncbi:MAG: hypothetical protein ACP5U0_09965 [Caldisphaera sp.]
MKKIWIILVSVIVIIFLATAFGYPGYFLNKNNSLQGSGGSTTHIPTQYNSLKILNFTTSMRTYECTNYLYYNSTLRSSLEKYPIINAFVYSKNPSSFQIEMKNPAGKNITLYTQNIVGYVNITYPQTVTEGWDYYVSYNNTGNYIISALLSNSSIYVTKSFTIHVNPFFEIENIKYNPSPVQLNIGTTINISAKYGVPPYNYKVNISAPNNSFRVFFNSSSFNYKFSQTGDWILNFNISDSAGVDYVGHETINVSNFDYLVNTQYTSVDVGVMDHLSVNVIGGAKPYNFEWVNEQDHNIISKNSSLNISFPTPGKYSYMVKVSNSYNISYKYFNITVNPYPQLLSLTQKYNQLDLNIKDYYYVNMSGGTLNNNSILISYYTDGQWSFNLTLANSSKNAENFYTSFYAYWYYWGWGNITYGPMNITVKIMDYGGAVFYRNFTLTLNPPLSASISIQPSNILVNDTVYLNTSISGGTAPYNYTWSITLPNFNTITLYGQNIKINASLQGYYFIQLTVADYFGMLSEYNADSYVTIYSGFNVNT